MSLVAMRWLTALVAAFVAVFILQVGTSTNTVSVASSSTQVIVMGNSLASGCCVPYEDQWATIFADKTGNDLINLGVGGTRSHSIIDWVHDWPSGRSQSQLYEALSLLEETKPGAVSAVTLGIGANDWLWLRDPDSGPYCAASSTPACDDLVSQALAGIETSLHIILTELTAALEPDTPLLVMTYYDIWNRDTTAAMNSIILSEIGEHGAIHVDVPAFFADRESEFISVDTVHPSAEGHRMIAEAFTNAIPPDSDNDGLADFVEVQLGLDPAMPDTDGDLCQDGTELFAPASKGGERDPLNPWDFYDVAGPGGGPPDGVVDLANDILGVILHVRDYDVRFDRGPSVGPNPWNMTAPDGRIDLANDILGVVFQFRHNCA